MSTFPVSELTGPALDWAVAKAEEFDGYLEDLGEGLCYEFHDGKRFIKWNPSSSWRQAGPIIEQEGISIELNGWGGDEQWIAYIRHDEEVFAATPLIAAMRVYVASKLGDEVEIPEELK